MKTSIENTVKNTSERAMYEFNMILTACFTAKSLELLAFELGKIEKYHTFFNYVYGFGGNHFWVSEIETKERILFVENE